jgi:hypothetical protein
MQPASLCCTAPPPTDIFLFIEPFLLHNRRFLGWLAELRKVDISFVMTVCPSA